MGKRKTAKKIQKKEKPRVMAQFDCPFCNHSGCIKVTINKKAKIGGCKCTICATDLWWVCRQVKYDTSITALSEPIDIFCEWIDECEKANDPKSAPAPPPPRRSGGLTADSDDDDD